eukprot:277607-Pleurochrysis_carterae.AAC.2
MPMVELLLTIATCMPTYKSRKGTRASPQHRACDCAMSEIDIAQAQWRFKARARAALAAARVAVKGVVETEGLRGWGIAAIQSAAVDACGLGLGEADCFLALSLLQ